MNIENERFQIESEIGNLSNFILTSAAPLLVHFQRALSTIKDARKKQ